MGPRKKAKTSKAEADTQAAEDQGLSQNQENPGTTKAIEQVETTPNQPADVGNGEKTSDSPAPAQSTSSWYGGTWPRQNKSNPVTQVAKESISAAGNAAGKVASDVVASARGRSPRPPSIPSPLRTPTSYLSREAASSTRSLPLAAASTKLNITSNSSDTQKSKAEEGLRRQSNTLVKRDSNPQQLGNGDAAKDKPAESANEVAKPDSSPPSVTLGQITSEEGALPNESTSWLGWFTKINNTNATSNPHQSIIDPKPIESLPSLSPRRSSDPTPSSSPIQQAEQHRSWLGIWKPTAKGMSEFPATTTGEITNVSAGADKQTTDGVGVITTGTPPDGRAAEAPKSYGWAFWSKDDSRDSSGKKRRPSNVGELALANSPSQSKPENAVIDESNGIPDRVNKRPRPQSMQEADDAPKTVTSKATSKQEKAGSIVTGSPKTANTAVGKAKTDPKNLILPSFRSTYRSASKPGFIQQLSRLFQFGGSSEPRHVEISSPRKVNRALAIGVHGYFPTPLIRSVLGQPTGTSIRFANSVASAIQRRCQEQGYSCEVEKVALEGEGRIAERLDLLWKLLLNWIEKIRKADLVMIACHSQGVPVAMMLVAKLISFGCVNSARIGVCAMAGVNMGPFNDYKSRWIGGSAGELFDFCVADSQVSKDYAAALEVAFKFGVRVVYIGSIDDQLVSLEV